ncbi:hypothetical protein NA57DRAFT_66007 [Rhizodiscina lignyota]|uniref:Uncharacterized protein n=1 Tax=Rhizodiscina lignyota TaxID=1504668 RepID=A0A9P4IB39_9PEZI|nr:hypothetical protein NA57DRAFT_66007 [Rhizodiscina lignyota]
MAANDQSIPTVQLSRPSRSSTASSLPSLRSPRAPRFAEATAVNSPIEPSKAGRNPFADPPTNHFMAQPQPSDVGFGYLSANHASSSQQGVEMEDTDTSYPPATPASPLRSPLKSALKSPGAPPRKIENPLSPTFREETVLEKEEEKTDKEQRRDLKAKFRVRVAKMFLRGVNFSCSLIVLSMLSATFSIFNATKSLPSRNGLPAWAPQGPVWPQVTLISIASVSLAMSIFIFIAYFRGGHKRAEKAAVYYTTFAIAFFIFSIVMWGVGAAILNQSKQNNNGNDIWGWSCKDNTRKQLFQDDVSYALVCRLQNWSLVCAIIEIVVEVFTIIIYGIVFYRFYSKRKLRKSMANRDRARSDLYLAQLRSQSAPNTPRYGPLSPREGGWQAPQGHSEYKDPYGAAEEGESQGIQYAVASPKTFAAPKPFALQAPPIRVQNATPRQEQEGWESVPMRADSVSPPLPQETQREHMGAAPGEQQYEAVPIPGSYASPISPSFPPATMQSGPHPGFDFGLNNGQQR